MKKGLILLVLVLMITLVTCGVQASYPLKVIDDTEEVRVILSEPQRIVSLAPSHTEILFALGLGERVVGRTDYCNYPTEVAQVPSVGGYSQPSVESIMAVVPDLVIASFGTPMEVLDQVRNLGIPVIGYNPQTLDDVLEMIWEVGKITGKETEAVLLTAEMKERIAAVQDLVKDADRPTVFWEVWHDPLYTAGPNNFINDIISIAGGINIAADADSSWPVYSLEVLLAKSPEVYIATQDQWANPGDIPGRPGYDQIKAVQQDRVYIINANNIERPGPRLIDGLEEVVQLIHPELF